MTSSKASRIRLLILDVDGVLTDGGVSTAQYAVSCFSSL